MTDTQMLNHIFSVPTNSFSQGLVDRTPICPDMAVPRITEIPLDITEIPIISSEIPLRWKDKTLFQCFMMVLYKFRCVCAQ